jgi:hypothetical protein
MLTFVCFSYYVRFMCEDQLGSKWGLPFGGLACKLRAAAYGNGNAVPCSLQISSFIS